MNDEIKEKDIIQKSIECLSNAKFNDTTYEVARDIILGYIANLQVKIDKAIEYIKNFNEPIEFFDTEELLDILKEDK